MCRPTPRRPPVCSPTGAAADLRARVDAMLAPIGLDRAVRTLRRNAACAARPVGAFDAPAIVLHARHDAVVALAHGEALAARCRRARLQVIEADTHLLPLTHVDACLAAVLSVHEPPRANDA